jgi:hypothetical protein
MPDLLNLAELSWLDCIWRSDNVASRAGRDARCLNRAMHSVDENQWKPEFFCGF